MWNAKEVMFRDTSNLMNDCFVSGRLRAHEAQTTDTHWRSGVFVCVCVCVCCVREYVVCVCVFVSVCCASVCVFMLNDCVCAVVRVVFLL